MTALTRTFVAAALVAIVAACGGASSSPAASVESSTATPTEAASAPTETPAEAASSDDAATQAPTGDLGTAKAVLADKSADMTIHECGAPANGWLRVVAGDSTNGVTIVLKPDGGVPEIEGTVAGTAFLQKVDTIDWTGGRTGKISGSDYTSGSAVVVSFTCK